MPTFRCYLKRISTQEPLPNRKEVFIITSNRKVHLTDLIETPNGYLAALPQQQDVESLLNSSQIKKSLNEVNLDPIPPQDLTEKRTLFVRGVEQEIGQQPASDILAQLKESNPNLRFEQVIKMKNRDRYFKIQFRDFQSAELALKDGFLIDYQRIPPQQVEHQIIASITTCRRCYALDKHATKDCPSPNLILCSNCTSDQHTYKECTSQDRNICINCTRDNLPNNHHTLALSCPLRKDLTNIKKKEIRTRKAARAQTQAPITLSGFSTALKYGLPTRSSNLTPLMSIQHTRPPDLNPQLPHPPLPPNFPDPIAVLSKPEVVKINALILDAHYAAINHPNNKSYNEIIKESMQTNFGIEANFPNHTHSKEILQEMIPNASVPSHNADDDLNSQTPQQQITDPLPSPQPNSHSSTQNSVTPDDASAESNSTTPEVPLSSRKRQLTTPTSADNRNKTKRRPPKTPKQPSSSSNTNQTSKTTSNASATSSASIPKTPDAASTPHNAHTPECMYNSPQNLSNLTPNPPPRSRSNSSNQDTMSPTSTPTTSNNPPEIDQIRQRQIQQYLLQLHGMSLT